jgi:type I restriction enzyme, S subunit
MGADWITCTVGDISAPSRNALVGGPFGSDLVSRDYLLSGVPVIRGANMSHGRWVDGDFVFVSPEKADSLSSNLARPGDILFTQRGTLGQVALIPNARFDRYLISQSQMKLTVDPAKVCSQFLYYVFTSAEQQAYIRQNAIQTGVPHTNLGILRGTPVVLPSLSSQKSIAHILGTLDDKIELNRRMNDTLEAMARALFKSWFVDFDPVRAKSEGRTPAGMSADTAKLFPSELVGSRLGFIPKGWTHVSVRATGAELFDGPHATPPESEGGAIFLGIKNFTPTSLNLADVRYIAEHDYPRWTKRVVPTAGDIVFTYEATLGFFALIPPGVRCCLGRRTALIRPQAGRRDGHFLLEWFVAAPFQEFLRAHRQPGSTVDRIWLKDFPSYPVLRPPDELVSCFDEVIAPVWALIHAAQEESILLRKTRDELLPRLLSGELSVASAERAAGAAL